MSYEPPAVKDIALTAVQEFGEPPRFLAHRIDCPDARAAAAAGQPVLTMFDIQGQLPADVARHECLQ